MVFGLGFSDESCRSHVIAGIFCAEILNTIFLVPEMYGFGVDMCEWLEFCFGIFHVTPRLMISRCM